MTTQNTQGITIPSQNVPQTPLNTPQTGWGTTATIVNKRLSKVHTSHSYYPNGKLTLSSNINNFIPTVIDDVINDLSLETLSLDSDDDYDRDSVIEENLSDFQESQNTTQNLDEQFPLED